MAERLPFNSPLNPEWRVLMIVGTLGVYGGIDRSRIDALPLEASMHEGVLQPGDRLFTEPVPNSEAFYLDWLVKRGDDFDALAQTVGSTLRLLDLPSAGLAGTGIQAVKVAPKFGRLRPSPESAWHNMPDHTASLGMLASYARLPDTLHTGMFDK